MWRKLMWKFFAMCGKERSTLEMRAKNDSKIFHSVKKRVGNFHENLTKRKSTFCNKKILLFIIVIISMQLNLKLRILFMVIIAVTLLFEFFFHGKKKMFSKFFQPKKANNLKGILVKAPKRGK
jgi:hypothetical protein